MTPVAIRTAPAAREKSKKKLSDFRRGSIAQRSQIRNQTRVPKQNRNRKISRNRKDIPYQRAPEVWPDCPVVRHRREVPRHPDTTHMNAWENRGANDRKKCHRFRGAVNRSAPFLVEQKQDGRDQCASVSDTNPKNEVRDVPGPANRMIQSPGADAGGNLVTEAKKTERRHARSDRKNHPPPPRRGLLHHSGDSPCQPTEVALVQDQRHARERPLGFFDHLRRCWCCVHIKSRIADCGLGHNAAPRIENRKSKIENSLCWFLLEACDTDVCRVRHFRIRVANTRQITRSRIDVQIFEQAIIAVLHFHFRDAAFRVLYVAKNKRSGGTCLRARRSKRIARDKRIG